MIKPSEGREHPYKHSLRIYMSETVRMALEKCVSDNDMLDHAFVL